MDDGFYSWGYFVPPVLADSVWQDSHRNDPDSFYHPDQQSEYGKQLEIYKVVLQHLTGKHVKETILLAI